MLKRRKEDVKKPFLNATGEKIFEMIGRPEHLGGSTQHSFGHVVIPPDCSSRPHYHPKAEETYYILKGAARMVVEGEEFELRPGDALLILPPEKHQIFNDSSEDLEFLVVCAPAWEPTNSVYLDETGG